ncbi:hypothetical protein NMYAN_80121 [Nitrosomonas nitrosa]|uniref:Uncharacterized protein n=1 Tax=Nitrosomonas nitrosa TaxID=52442 RepID=A0A8H9DCL1_9PROT|nr:hypothetical protein NMYAN_80121 [Nitrosomonas nitrosa]
MKIPVEVIIAVGEVVGLEVVLAAGSEVVGLAAGVEVLVVAVRREGGE